MMRNKQRTDMMLGFPSIFSAALLGFVPGIKLCEMDCTKPAKTMMTLGYTNGWLRDKPGMGSICKLLRDNGIHGFHEAWVCTAKGPWACTDSR